MRKGPLFAFATVVTWAFLGIVNRYFVTKFGINIMIFTSYLIFAGGVALLCIRQQTEPKNWKSGVQYSWLYTIMQMIKSFFMISTYLYISTTETSLLINIEVVITYLLAYLFFKRIPHRNDWFGIILILTGFVLFILTLSASIRTPTAVLLLIAATASCIRSIVVEKTTYKSPATTVRQKCGISGYTMFIGGCSLILFFTFIAVLKFFFNPASTGLLSYLNYLPDLPEIINPVNILSGCAAGFFIDSASVYFFYATLKWAKSETFMAFRVFQPALTYGFELIAALSYTAMRPQLNGKDFLLAGIILTGSALILLLSPASVDASRSKDFITE